MTVSQRLPADYEEKVATFRSYCKSKIAENNIEAKHIINMDEVPLTFDMLLIRTVEKTRTPTVPVCTTGNKKSSFTVVLGVSSDGQIVSPMWILDAWSKVTPATIIRGFARADIIPGFNTSDGIESAEADDSEDEDTGDTGSGLLDTAITQLMISDMEDEDFEGFEGFTEDEQRIRISGSRSNIPAESTDPDSFCLSGSKEEEEDEIDVIIAALSKRWRGKIANKAIKEQSLIAKQGKLSHNTLHVEGTGENSGEIPTEVENAVNPIVRTSDIPGRSKRAEPGLKNSPTICQWYVAKVLSPVCQQMADVLLYHYMDDILVAVEQQEVKKKALALVTEASVILSITKPGLNANVLNVGYCGTVHLIKGKVFAITVIQQDAAETTYKFSS
ncbi:hypothetical protein TURU_071791 [Turdus rufiventris]|nr:hypothetical protein TURU_071791 [Turdus rufiventris]